ncbi:hypothetical protein U1Q18_043508 [Sarracenia purpurea var. burkii]
MRDTSHGSLCSGLISDLVTNPTMTNSVDRLICKAQEAVENPNWEAGHKVFLGPQTGEERYSTDLVALTENKQHTLDVTTLGNFSEFNDQGRDNIAQVTGKLRPEEHKTRKWKSRARSNLELRSKTEREVEKKRSAVEAGGEELADEGICCSSHKKSRFELNPTGIDDQTCTVVTAIQPHRS